MEKFLQPFIIALIVNLILGTTALFFKLVSWSGYIGGLSIGIATLTFAGVGAYVILCVFFALGTAFSKMGVRIKKARSSHQEEGGRGSKHALANCIVGVVAGLGSAFLPRPDLFLLALVSAFATALADTTSNELGQILGRRPVLPTTFKPVPAGTDGAVSLQGTLLGIAGSVLIAGLGLIFNIINWWGFLAVIVGALVGNYVESVISAGKPKRFSNELLNLLNTLIGALVAVSLYLLLTL